MDKGNVPRLQQITCVLLSNFCLIVLLMDRMLVFLTILDYRTNTKPCRTLQRLLRTLRQEEESAEVGGLIKARFSLLKLLLQAIDLLLVA